MLHVATVMSVASMEEDSVRHQVAALVEDQVEVGPLLDPPPHHQDHLRKETNSLSGMTLRRSHHHQHRIP